MSKTNVNQLIAYEKAKQLESEEQISHFANNFSILEPNQYDDDEAMFKHELKSASRGWQIIHI